MHHPSHQFHPISADTKFSASSYFRYQNAEFQTRPQTPVCRISDPDYASIPEDMPISATYMHKGSTDEHASVCAFIFSAFSSGIRKTFYIHSCECVHTHIFSLLLPRSIVYRLYLCVLKSGGCLVFFYCLDSGRMCGFYLMFDD